MQDFLVILFYGNDAVSTLKPHRQAEAEKQTAVRFGRLSFAEASEEKKRECSYSFVADALQKNTSCVILTENRKTKEQKSMRKTVFSLLLLVTTAAAVQAQGTHH